MCNVERVVELLERYTNYSPLVALSLQNAAKHWQLFSFRKGCLFGWLDCSFHKVFSSTEFSQARCGVATHKCVAMTVLA